MKLKICGLKETGNILNVGALKPDYAGFIFFPGSPRYAGELHPSAVKTLPESTSAVGVFVNAGPSYILEKVQEYGLDHVQLHGDEGPEQCAELNAKVNVIKAFGVNVQFDFRKLKEYEKHCRYFMFDTRTIAYGGSGKKFNWSLLNNYSHEVPFFLSGGIDLEDIYTISAKSRDWNLHAIDVNSRFEHEPGIKNIDKLKQLISILHEPQDDKPVCR
jgi:phosphoribosylanthranilate isomerase